MCFASWRMAGGLNESNFTSSNVPQPFWRVFAPTTRYFSAIWKWPHLPSGGTFRHRLVNTPHHRHKRFHQDFVGTDQIIGGQANIQLYGKRSLMKRRSAFQPKCLLTPYFAFFLFWFVTMDGRRSEKSPPLSLASSQNGCRTEAGDTLFRNNLLGFIPQPSHLVRCKTPHNTSLNHVCALY